MESGGPRGGLEIGPEAEPELELLASQLVLAGNLDFFVVLTLNLQARKLA